MAARLFPCRILNKTFRLLALSISFGFLFSGTAMADNIMENFLSTDILGNDGFLSIVVSFIALLGSVYSFYMTVLKRAKVDTHVGSVIQFQSYNIRQGFTEFFNIPVTLVNSGARSATILSITLEVNNPRLAQSKYYYPLATGSFQDSFNGRSKPFSPIAIAGRKSETTQLIFDRIPGQEDSPQQIEQDIRHVEVEGGTFDFTLILEVTSAGKVRLERVKFSMSIGPLNYQRFTNGGSIPMYNVNFNLAKNVPEPSQDLNKAA